MPPKALKSVEDARAEICRNAKRTPSELCPIHFAGGRILGGDIIALLDNPAGAVSSMDGYAVGIGANDLDKGAEFSVIGEASAGHMLDKMIGVGEAVRIFTGAHLPKGCDSVILQEDVRTDKNRLYVDEPIKVGQFVRPKGLDFKKGETLIPMGTKIRARHLALMALSGHSKIEVRKQPLVGIVSSGDELVYPGDPIKAGQLVNSNNLLLAEIIRQAGAKPVELGIIGDQAGALINRLEEHVKTQGHEGFDLIVTTGGASVGTHDHIASDLTAHKDSHLGFWRIAMRPGKPLIFGHWRHIPFLGLPGNPVSAGVCALVFVLPLIRALLGIEKEEETQKAVLACDLPENDRRQDYIRSIWVKTAKGTNEVAPLGRQDSSMLRSFSDADILIIRPPLAAPCKAGDIVSILPLPYGL